MEGPQHRLGMASRRRRVLLPRLGLAGHRIHVPHSNLRGSLRLLDRSRGAPTVTMPPVDTNRFVCDLHPPREVTPLDLGRPVPGHPDRCEPPPSQQQIIPIGPERRRPPRPQPAHPYRTSTPGVMEAVRVRRHRISHAFYPYNHFTAGTTHQDRTLSFTTAAIGSPLDATLDEARQTGWALHELPPRHTQRTDSEAAHAAAGLAARLLARGAAEYCEHHPEGKLLTATDVALGVVHRDQADQIRRALPATGVPNADQIPVDTANRLQGREYEVVIVVHPLSGRRDRLPPRRWTPMCADLASPPRLHRRRPRRHRRPARRPPRDHTCPPQRASEIPRRLVLQRHLVGL